MKNPLLSLIHVYRKFGKQTVLSDIDVDFPRVGLIGLVGASGSGKSTLLNIVSGLDSGYSGSCIIKGKELRHLSEKQRSEFRLRNIGYVFQSFNLLELETALTNVLLPLDALSNASPTLKKRKALDLLSFVGLQDRANEKVSNLSGGEKQRICFARALANDPDLLLCDEPSGALDEHNATLVFELMKAIAKHKLVLVVSHDRKLVERYAAYILCIHDGHLSGEALLKKDETLPSPLSVDLNYPKKTPRLSSLFLFKHAFHLLRAKKLRSLISETAIAIGLLGLGLSLFVSNSIHGELEGAFSSLVAANQIVMSPLNPVANPFSQVYSAPLTHVQELCSRYDEVKDYGTSYLVDFESFYCDKNELVIPHNSKEIVLPSFSIRTCNDYLWLDDYPDLHYYPEKPKIMENDQIVLGLPFASMTNLCFGLQILRNYEALGLYIRSHGLPAIFKLAHYAWQYEDEQLFKVMGVTAANVPTIYHLNHHWTSYLFEESMRFPSSDHEDHSLPWIMNKVFYLEAKQELAPLLKDLREDPLLASDIFERPSGSYDQTHCPVGEVCPLKRAYVYLADKTSIPYRDILKAQSLSQEIVSRLICTSGSYYAYPSSLMMGFAQKFFLCQKEETIDTISDGYSNVLKKDAGLDIALPEGTVDGYFLKSASGGLSFSSDFRGLTSGRLPQGIEEVALSSSLYEAWGQPKEVYVAAETSSREEGDYLIRNFSRGYLKVVGVVSNERSVLYGIEDWTIDYFRDALGMSSFLLEPTNVIFTTKDKTANAEVLSRLAKAMPNYHFVDPSQSIVKSIASTTDYVGMILLAFSLVALVISSLLFIIVMMVAVAENKGEAYLLYVLGISRSDIARSYAAECACYCGLALGVSLASMLLSEALIHGYIASSFNSVSPFRISFNPLLAMGGFTLGTFLFVSLFIRIFLSKARFTP